MLRFACLALLASLASAAITFKDCGHAEVKSVTISSCTSTHCTFHKGKQVTVDVEFVANQDSKKAEIQALAKIGELEIQIPGIDTDGCAGHVHCPLKKGETYQLKYTLTVPEASPTAEADITAKLIGDNGVLACGTIHSSIVA